MSLLASSKGKSKFAEIEKVFDFREMQGQDKLLCKHTSVKLLYSRMESRFTHQSWAKADTAKQTLARLKRGKIVSMMRTNSTNRRWTG